MWVKFILFSTSHLYPEQLSYPPLLIKSEVGTNEYLMM